MLSIRPMYLDQQYAQEPTYVQCMLELPVFSINACVCLPLEWQYYLAGHKDFLPYCAYALRPAEWFVARMVCFM